MWSPAMQISDAADAARPSTVTSTRARCLRREFMIATPSQAEPPGELMYRRMRSTSRSASSAANAFAFVPQYPISS